MTSSTAFPERRGASTVLAAAAAAMGTGAWLAFVVRNGNDQSSLASGAPFWWAMTLAALGLGLIAGRRHAPSIGFGLGLPPLLLSPWTMPCGDNDGLWILGIPMMFVALFVYLVAAATSGALHDRLRSYGESLPADQ